MKHTRAVFLSAAFIFTCLFTACADSSPLKSFFPQQTFVLEMTAQKGDKTFGADITCNGYNDIKISFTYPEELSGFTITADEDSFSVNAFGIIDEITEAELNKSSLLHVLTETVRTTVFTASEKFEADGDSLKADLTIGNTPVSVTFSREGYLTGMEAPTMDFSAVFKFSG